MSASIPAAIPHRLRLWAILIATLLDVAALIAMRLDVAPELIGEIRPLVDSALYAVLGLLVLGLGDAYMVERRRRTPGIPALPDDDQVGNGGPHIVAPLPWPPPPTPPDPPRRSSTLIEPATPPPPPPPDPPVGGAGLALVLVVVAAALSAATSGCSARALGAQADLVASGGILWTEADATLVELRAADLDSIVDAAREECADGCSEERQAHWRAELAAAEERWAPAMTCRATVPAALRSWLDGIEAAREAKTSEIGMQLLARLGGRFALDYVAFVGCVNARAPVDEPHLPALPAELEALAEMLTEATSARTAGGEDGTR